MKAIAPVAACLCLLLGSADLYAQDSTVATSDFDGSGKVDFQDFVLFARGFGRTSTDAGFDARLDLDGSGKVDFQDFVRFAESFGKTVGEPSRPLMYVSDLDPEAGGGVLVFDPETNLLDRTIPATFPRGMAFSSLNRRLYVAGVDTFYAFTESDAVDFKIPFLDPPLVPGELPPTRGGFKIALSPDGRFAFVTASQAGAVDVIDLRAKEVAAQIPVGPNPVGIAISPDGSEVYAAHAGGAVAVVDGVLHALVDSIPVGNLGTRRLAISQDGSRLYLTSFARVASTQAADSSIVGQILAIDTASRSVVDTLWVGGPADPQSVVEDLAVSKDGAFLYATVNRAYDAFDEQFGFVLRRWQAKLAIADTETFDAVGEIEVEGAEQLYNFGISPDGKTGYATGRESIFEIPVQIFILDLEDRVSVGPLRGFSIPVEIRFGAGKPTGPVIGRPELAVF